MTADIHIAAWQARAQTADEMAQAGELDDATAAQIAVAARCVELVANGADRRAVIERAGRVGAGAMVQLAVGAM